jgi:hypothetical protein
LSRTTAVVHALLLAHAEKHCDVHVSNDDPFSTPPHGVAWDRYMARAA